MTTLAACFEVRRRFFRSVHLEADATRADACEGYALTPVGHATLGRMLRALAPGETARAWSLTGPYGVGKSAFVVLLAQLLALPWDEAHRLLARVTSVPGDLTEDLRRVRQEGRGFCPVLVTATFGPLVPPLLGALEKAIAHEAGPQVEALRREMESVRQASHPAEALHRRLVDLVSKTAAFVSESQGRGLVIVLDELGKTLEHATRSRDRADDVFLLQELAELAARSGTAPVLLVTLLHQSFDRYARGLGAENRAEWSKVQGRFEDVAFLDAPAEILHLAARSLARREGVAAEVFAPYDARATQAVALGLAAPDAHALLCSLAPLHPTVALLLPGLFRGPLVQNERSLFGFLTARAPGAMGAFVESTPTEGGPAYTLDRLYDYIAATLGPAQLATPEGRRWAAVEDALVRLAPDLPPRTAAVVKAIGMLSLLGSRTVRASRAVLGFALATAPADEAEVHRALEALIAASYVVYRRHSDAYALWEGSDVDLDARFDEARRASPGIEALSDLLRARMVLRPRVARRHFIETGTLRYFEVALASPDNVGDGPKTQPEGADGRIVYLLPAGEESQHDLVALATKSSHPPDLVIGVPREAGALVAGARDWCAWDTVRTRGRDLEGDPVARRELAARLRVASASLDDAVQSCFGFGEGDAVAWVNAGALQSWQGARGITWGLSAVCDEVYASGPRLRNELLNRQSLSSAAAAARRALLDAMLGASDRPGLGIEGSPPERSMYASLLEAGGIHRVREGVWGFGPPPPDDPLRLLPTWQAIASFLDRTEGEARPLAELFALLAERPIGLRAGPAPVLFFAVVLSTPGEVALFEDGTFVTELTGAVVERLLRRIGHFTVARYRVRGARAAVVQGLARVLGAEAARPVEVVRAMVRRITLLPRFTRTTRNASDLGLALRDTIVAARDPLRLLFDDLPRALGLRPLGAEEGEDSTVAVDYALRLAEGLAALSETYPRLLATIEARLASSLDLDLSGDALRAALTARAKRLLGVSVDLRLRAFLGRAVVADVAHNAWLEGVAMVVGNRPPAEWSDSELVRFALGLEEIRAMLRRAETLAAPVVSERPEVAPEDVARVTDAEHEILALLEARLGARRDVWLAALGRTLHRVRDTGAPDTAPPHEEAP